MFTSVGLDSPSLNWFSNYLTGRTQVVSADGVRSNSLVLHKDVPQGSILGPLLFSLYVNNIVPSFLTCNIHYYADDTKYSIAPTLKSAVDYLQSAFNHFQLSLIAHKLVLNSEKTKCMLFTRSNENNSCLSIETLHGQLIETVITYNYLGIWLDSKLSFRTHVDHLIKKLRPRIVFFI